MKPKIWSPGTGAHLARGLILARYAELGWETSDLGFPTSDEFCGLRDRGCAQRFEREAGHIYWSPATGAHFMRGLILQKFGQLGWENSQFGYPVTDELCGLRDGGCFQVFQHEDGHLYWSPRTGAWPSQGAIFGYWGSQRWENGRLGYPTGAEQCRSVPDALECGQNFQGGRITWNSRTGATG